MAHSAQKQPNSSALIRKAKRCALGSGVEDSNGFWELLWELRTLFPEVDDEQLLRASQQALGDLVEQRLLLILWWDPSSDTETDLHPTEAISFVSRDEHWVPPQGRNEKHLRFVATTVGERSYYDYSQPAPE
jgi:hypothetical protein